MKSEERHRLQETELEKWGRQAQQFWESFMKDYAKIALIGIAAICLIGGIVIWRLSVSAAQEGNAWHEVISATFNNDSAKSIEQFALTAEQYKDHPAGHWAALMEAERALSQGIQTARTNREASVQELVRARAAFNQLAEAKSDLIQERRLFGLARTLETLAGVDVSDKKDAENVKGVEEAIEAYELFLQRHPDSIFASLAEDRISALKTDRAQDFYVWFREQNPVPEDRTTPADGGPGSLPPGHPPIGPGASPTGPGFPPQPVTEEGLMQELETIVKGAKGTEEEEKAPDFPMTDETPKGPELPSPKPAEKPEANEPETSTPETKTPEQPAPAKPE